MRLSLNGNRGNIRETDQLHEEGGEHQQHLQTEMKSHERASEQQEQIRAEQEMPLSDDGAAV